MNVFRRMLWICFLFIPAFALGQVQENIVVPGDPPISLDAVKAHIRLMEFVLATRLTTGQKKIFLESVKKECSGMEKSEKEEFLQGVDLLKSMVPMTGEQRDSVREILRADFEQSAEESGDDPAAKLFFEVSGSLQKKVAESAALAVTAQALNAFVEYLEFCRGLPQDPTSLNDQEKKQLGKSLETSFNTLPDPMKIAISGFDRTWHLIKTAWKEGPADAKARWLKTMRESVTASAPAALFDEKWLTKGIQPGLWQEMASAAATLGEYEANWIASKPVDVW